MYAMNVLLVHIQLKIEHLLLIVMTKVLAAEWALVDHCQNGPWWFADVKSACSNVIPSTRYAK